MELALHDTLVLFTLSSILPLFGLSIFIVCCVYYSEYIVSCIFAAFRVSDGFRLVTLGIRQQSGKQAKINGEGAGGDDGPKGTVTLVMLACDISDLYARSALLIVGCATLPTVEQFAWMS